MACFEGVDHVLTILVVGKMWHHGESSHSTSRDITPKDENGGLYTIIRESYLCELCCNIKLPKERYTCERAKSRTSRSNQ